MHKASTLSAIKEGLARTDEAGGAKGGAEVAAGAQAHALTAHGQADAASQEGVVVQTLAGGGGGATLNRRIKPLARVNGGSSTRGMRWNR